MMRRFFLLFLLLLIVGGTAATIILLMATMFGASPKTIVIGVRYSLTAMAAGFVGGVWYLARTPHT